MDDILNITQKATFDNSISGVEIHSFSPYNTAFSNSDEISIIIQKQDLIIHSADSYIYFEGSFLKADKTVSTKSHLVKNPMCHLFDEARFVINNTEVCRTKNLGITTTMKNYCSLNKHNSHGLHHTGWFDEDTKLMEKGQFSFCVPLKSLFGMAEDFSKVLINAKLELILIRSRNDNNAMVIKDNENMNVVISKISWKLPIIRLNDQERLRFLKTIDNDSTLQIFFRNWEIFEFPNLPATDKHLWSVKTSSQIQTPRFVIIGFQTNRKNNSGMNSSIFDHLSLRNIKLHLNTEVYPYENLNVNFENNQYSILYDMYAKFQMNYYNTPNQPILSYEEFKSKAPLIVLDCSRQNESIKSSSIDVAIEFETHANIPENSSAYCLILYDKIISYNPLTGLVKQM